MYNFLFQSNEEEDDEVSVRGMGDHSRLTLFTAMFTVIAFNPFGYALDKMSTQDVDYTSTSDGSRTILSGKLKIMTTKLRGKY